MVILVIFQKTIRLPEVLLVMNKIPIKKEVLRMLHIVIIYLDKYVVGHRNHHHYELFIYILGLEDEPLKLSIEASPEPANEAYRLDATDQLYARLTTNDGRKDLSEYLSDGLDSKISVDKVYKGSIILELKVKTYSALHEIKYLSDQGVLSNMLNCFLVTPEYKAACQAEKVLLTVKVDERSYLTLVENAQSIPFDISISVAEL